MVPVQIVSIKTVRQYKIESTTFERDGTRSVGRLKSGLKEKWGVTVFSKETPLDPKEIVPGVLRRSETGN